MSTGLLPAPLGSDYRHVVFADEIRAPRRALNLDPTSSTPVPSRAPGPLTPDASAFAWWLFSKAGLDARDYREETLARRLPACLRLLRVERFDEARTAIESDPRRLQTALDAMVIGVTGFFRDRQVFSAIHDAVMPALARGRVNLRVWCAGCSNGAEVHALAMVLAQRGWLHRTHLLGTDCRPTAIAEASAGVYDASEVRGIAREWLEPFFVPIEGGRAWRVRPGLHTMLAFRVADVLRAAEPGPWDMIFCRNLAMYLRPDALRLLWQRLYAVLRPGGVLVLGKAERPVGVPMSAAGPCIFRRDVATDAEGVN